jgi:hypothetical protein
MAQEELPADGNGRSHRARLVHGRSCGWAGSACLRSREYPPVVRAQTQSCEPQPCSPVKQVHHSCFHTGRIHSANYLIGNVMHVAVTLGLERDLLLIIHFGSSFHTANWYHISSPFERDASEYLRPNIGGLRRFTEIGNAGAKRLLTVKRLSVTINSAGQGQLLCVASPTGSWFGPRRCQFSPKKLKRAEMR